MKFRKKPVIVEAIRWWKNGDHPEDGDQSLAPAMRSEGKIVRYFRRPSEQVSYPDVQGATLCTHCERRMFEHGWIDKGSHIVCPGDWIVTGVVGERYPVKSTIFEATYEAVT